MAKDEMFKMALFEVAKGKEFRQKLNGNILTQAQVLSRLHEALSLDEQKIRKLHKNAQTAIASWKGDLEEELMAWSEGHEKKMLQREINELHGFSKFVGNTLAGIDVKMSLIKQKLMFNKMKDKQKMQLTGLFRDLKTGIATYLYHMRSQRKKLAKLNELCQELDVKTHKMKNYKMLVDAKPEMLQELLHGKGYFSQFNQEQRKDIWNRWQGSSEQRTLVGMDLSGLNLNGYNFDHVLFEKCRIN